MSPDCSFTIVNLVLYQLLDNGDTSSRASGIASGIAMEGETGTYSENFLNSSAAPLEAPSSKSKKSGIRIIDFYPGN